MANRSLKRSRVAERLERDLKEQIRGGQLAPGDLILSMSELGARYGLKRPTVQKALGRLEAAGYVSSKPGSGTYVADGFRNKTVRLYVSHSSALDDFFDAWLQKTALDIRRVEKRTEADVICGSGGTTRHFQQRGGVLPLDERVAGHPLGDPGGWVTDIADLYRFGERTYGLPVWGSPLVIYFNRDLFKKAGVAAPRADWTWDDFSAAVRQLRGVCELERAGVFPFMDTFTLYVPFIVQNGGAIFGWDGRCLLSDERALEAIAFLRAARADAGGTLCATFDELAERLLGGGCAMTLWSGLMLDRLKRENAIDWGWVPLPKRRARATLIFSEGLMIASTAAGPDAAWQFVQECVSDEAQAHFVERGFPFPARRAAADALIAEQGPEYRGYLDEMQHAVIEHYRYGPDVFHVLAHEMRGILDPDLAESDVREKCRHTSRVAESLIRAQKSAADQQLIA
ncbi:MAG: extracellular solute-binding protein [Kiritimatiellae bacterium]|nr:extracellular solute-binding protein [Kiritimatiellia bacterium]